MCDCFRKLNAFFSELFLVRPSSHLLLWRDVVHSLSLGKNFGFGCHVLKSPQEFFPSANYEHLNGISLDFARRMLVGGKEEPSGFT